jgi:glycerate kinase
MIKHYLKAKLKEDYKNEVFLKLARTPGTGASGGLVAAMLACFDKSKIVSGMDYVD